MREKNIWERIRNSSNCRVLILNLILTLCLNLLLEFTERRSVGEVITFVQERTFVFLYNGFTIFLCFSQYFLYISFFLIFLKTRAQQYIVYLLIFNLYMV